MIYFVFIYFILSIMSIFFTNRRYGPGKSFSLSFSLFLNFFFLYRRLHYCLNRSLLGHLKLVFTYSFSPFEKTMKASILWLSSRYCWFREHSHGKLKQKQHMKLFFFSFHIESTFHFNHSIVTTNT